MATLGADLSLPTQSSGAGTSVQISTLFSPGSSSAGSLQFDLTYDNTAMSLAAIPGSAARNSLKSLYSTDIAPNQKRFIVAGLNQTPIQQGSVVDLFLNLVSNAPSGTYALTISNFITSDIAGNMLTTTATNGAIIVGGASGSRLQSTGVLNAASLLSGSVAPGEIITLLGSGIGPSPAVTPVSSPATTMLAGTTVMFDQTMAPLLYAGPNQINAVVPFEISGQSSTNVVVESGGLLIAGFPLSVSSASPGIFTIDSTGSGPGAILNQDLTLNTAANPAARGSIAVLYATGAGVMSPNLVDGQAAGSTSSQPTLPVSVMIGGINAQIAYEGSAPGLIAGLLQVNFVVPTTIAPGSSVSVTLTVGDISSPSGVIMAVQ